MNDDCKKNAIKRREEQVSGDGEDRQAKALSDGITKTCRNIVTICEIVTLPGLHQRKPGTKYRPYTGATARVIEFPAPRWRQNAEARR